jgi:hypothetical protein
MVFNEAGRFCACVLPCLIFDFLGLTCLIVRAQGFAPLQADVKHCLADTERGRTDAEHCLADTEHCRADAEHWLADIAHCLADTEHWLADTELCLADTELGWGDAEHCREDVEHCLADDHPLTPSLKKGGGNADA